jgi:hypothetical protein
MHSYLLTSPNLTSRLLVPGLVAILASPCFRGLAGWLTGWLAGCSPCRMDKLPEAGSRAAASLAFREGSQHSLSRRSALATQHAELAALLLAVHLLAPGCITLTPGTICTPHCALPLPLPSPQATWLCSLHPGGALQKTNLGRCSAQ